MLSRMLAFGAHRLPRVKGKDRLFRAAIRTSSKHEKFVIERAGVRYEVGGDDLIDYYLMANDFESPIVVEALAKHIGDRPLCLWDIGANVGGVALPLLRCCPNLRAVLFEPSPGVGGRLIRNLQLNPDFAERTQIMSMALSNSKGWTDFYLSAFSGNSGIGGLASAGHRTAVGLKVAMDRGDQLGALVPSCDVIKIDVEGFEREVLEGLGALLDRRPLIVFEHSPSLLGERGLPKDTVMNFLRDKGYNLTSLRFPQIVLNSQDDVLASPV